MDLKILKAYMDAEGNYFNKVENTYSKGFQVLHANGHPLDFIQSYEVNDAI